MLKVPPPNRLLHCPIAYQLHVVLLRSGARHLINHKAHNEPQRRMHRHAVVMAPNIWCLKGQWVCLRGSRSLPSWVLPVACRVPPASAAGPCGPQQQPRAAAQGTHSDPGDGAHGHTPSPLCNVCFAVQCRPAMAIGNIHSMDHKNIRPLTSKLLVETGGATSRNLPNCRGWQGLQVTGQQLQHVCTFLPVKPCSLMALDSAPKDAAFNWPRCAWSPMNFSLASVLLLLADSHTGTTNT
jgi:hypothetical protein